MPLLKKMGPLPDRDQSNRFRTYLNYLSALAIYLDQEYDDANDLITSITQSKAFQRIKPSKGSLVSETQKLLRHAWFTEMQIAGTNDDVDFLRYANHWSLIQLYYAVFLAIRALFVASRRNIGETHKSTLSQISNDIDKRGYLFPHPWKVMCIGDSTKKTHSYLYLPNGISIDESVSPLRSPSYTDNDFWDSYGMILRTTRDRSIEELKIQWRSQNKRKRVLKHEQVALVNGLHKTTLFDFLYRLRIRSNYEGADSFLMSEQGDSDAYNFHWAVEKICWYTMLIFETIIGKYIGKCLMEDTVTDFTKRVRLGNPPIEKRWEFLSVTL